MAFEYSFPQLNGVEGQDDLLVVQLDDPVSPDPGWILDECRLLELDIVVALGEEMKLEDYAEARALLLEQWAEHLPAIESAARRRADQILEALRRQADG